MDTLSAYTQAMMAKGQPQRTFDWDKAARLIAERKPKVAEAGLSEDWEWTGGEIYRDGAPVKADDTYVYLSSNWATPALMLDGDKVECWVAEKDAPGWGPKTYWPESALAILKGGK